MILDFYNLQNDTWLVKNGNTVLYDSIRTNQVLYLPMISKTFDIEEANSYRELPEDHVFPTVDYMNPMTS
jgi:hypothetical protein